MILLLAFNASAALRTDVRPEQLKAKALPTLPPSLTLTLQCFCLGVDPPERILLSLLAVCYLETNFGGNQQVNCIRIG